MRLPRSQTDERSPARLMLPNLPDCPRSPTQAVLIRRAVPPAVRWWPTEQSAVAADAAGRWPRVADPPSTKQGKGAPRTPPAQGLPNHRGSFFSSVHAYAAAQQNPQQAPPTGQSGLCRMLGRLAAPPEQGQGPGATSCTEVRRHGQHVVPDSRRSDVPTHGRGSTWCWTCIPSPGVAAKNN